LSKKEKEEILQTLQLKEVIDKLKNNELQYNQFYNANIEASHYFAIQHFTENKHDTIDMNQKLKILFFDIECYFNNQTEVVDFKKAEGVINAITIYDNKTKIYHAFLLLMSDKNQNLVDFDNKEEYIKTYKKELIENNYITEDEDIQLYFYVDDELTFIEECWQLIHQIDPVLMSGFNCIYEEESVWLEDKITKIKNITTDDKTNIFGNILNHVNTGKKQGHNIKLVNGTNLICSKDHRIPIFQKLPKKYINSSHFLIDTNWKNIKCNEIDFNFHNFVCIQKGSNINPDLTYRDIILNNLDIYLEHELDFIVCDNNTIQYMMKHHKDTFTNTSQYETRNCWKRSPKRWRYSYLKQYFNETHFCYYLENVEELPVYINNLNYFILNLNEKVHDDIWYLLGLLRTDGNWDNSRRTFYICNTNDGIIDECKRIMLEQNIIKHERNWPTNDNGVTYCKFGAGNKLSLLTPFIYNLNRKKSYNVELLSQLSYTQSLQFIAGLFDGDGCWHKCTSGLTIAVKNKEEKKKLCELLLWNGMFSYIEKGAIYVANNQYNIKVFNSLPLRHSKKKTSKHLKLRKITKDSKSKLINIKETDNFVFVRIKEIEKMDQYYNMYDITTESGYFESSLGMIIHNCDGFDLPYFYNRLTKLYNGDEKKTANTLSKFGVVKTRKYSSGTILYQIPEYPIADIRRLYVPRDEGGYLIRPR